MKRKPPSPSPTDAGGFPAHLRTWIAYGRHVGAVDHLEAFRGWQTARRTWLTEHGYMRPSGQVDWHRFYREHPHPGTGPSTPPREGPSGMALEGAEGSKISAGDELEVVKHPEYTDPTAPANDPGKRRSPMAPATETHPPRGQLA